MLTLPVDETSYWQDSAAAPSFPALSKDLKVDAVIVGGGIAGLTTAYLLKQAGLKVAVLEKNTLGSGTTSGTTGKVTSQHGLFYAELAKRKGKAAARLYAEANQAAIGRIEEIIEKEQIDCGWHRADNYVYTTDRRQLKKFRAEAKAAKSLGLPASFVPKLDLPAPVVGAVKFASQATFHPQKYILGLAKAVKGNGSHIFERSNVISFHDGTPAVVKTGRATVTAKNIIVATKVPAGPLIARGAYAALEHPHTSYIIAIPYRKRLKGMYISPDDGQYSILPVKDGETRLLLIGGENHTPGLSNARHRYQKLADYAERYFNAKQISYRWRRMDYIAYDDVPLIGKVYPWSRHMYTATGFKKWGLTTSMVAATILRDTILGQENAWAPLFDSTRLAPVASIPRTIITGIKRVL